MQVLGRWSRLQHFAAVRSRRHLSWCYCLVVHRSSNTRGLVVLSSCLISRTSQTSLSYSGRIESLQKLHGRRFILVFLNAYIGFIWTWVLRKTSLLVMRTVRRNLFAWGLTKNLQWQFIKVPYVSSTTFVLFMIHLSFAAFNGVHLEQLGQERLPER